MNRKKCIDKRNEALYERVHAYYEVNFRRSSNHSWGSDIEGDKVIIEFSATTHLIASFTHELLHIDTQLNGYKRIRGGISLNKETNRELSRLTTCIDNEFQHHKMYNKFIAMGFLPEEFYNDLDHNVIPYLEKVLSTPNERLASLVVDYLTLIAPGGVIGPAKFEELKQTFQSYGDRRFLSHFQVVDIIISNWTTDESYDAEKYIKRLFCSLDAGPTWITYTDKLEDISKQNFPSTGFFTESGFTLEDLARLYAAVGGKLYTSPHSGVL